MVANDLEKDIEKAGEGRAIICDLVMALARAPKMAETSTSVP